MNDYQLTSFESVGGAREVTQHQAVLQEGPTNSPNFRIHGHDGISSTFKTRAGHEAIPGPDII